MLDVAAFEGFLQDFINYAAERDPASRTWLEEFLRTYRSKQLRESILAISDDDIANNELLNQAEHILYALYVAVYRNDEERLLKLHARLASLRVFTPLSTFVFAYDPAKKEFDTNHLLIRLADLFKKNVFSNFDINMLSDLHSPGFITNRELYADYDVQHTINLVNVMWAKELEESKKYYLPINMLFSVPYPNEQVYQFGLRLLNEGRLDPIDILSQSRYPKNNDYRLLNHCVERLIEERPFTTTDEALRHSYQGYLESTLWPSILSFVPAALYYRNRNDDRIQAASMGYKLAIAHCAVNNLQYTTSIRQGLSDLHGLWIQNYISDDQFFVAIMAMEPKIVRESLTLRAFLLSELCVAKGWTFLAEVFYAYMSGLTNFELLTTAELISIITNCQLYKRPDLAARLLKRLMWRELSDDEKQIAAMLQDKECATYAFHDAPLTIERFSLAKKYTAMPGALDVLCRVVRHFMNLSSAEAKVLSSWIENSYGRYIVEWFVTLYLTTGPQFNKDEIFNAVVKKTLLQFDPNTINPSQFEEVNVFIASYVPDNFKFQEAYHNTQYNIEHRDEITAEDIDYQKLLRLCRALIAELDNYQVAPSQGIASGLGMLSITSRNDAAVSDFKYNIRQLHKKLVNDGMRTIDGKQDLIRLVNDYILKMKGNGAFLLAQASKFFDLAEEDKLTNEHLIQCLQQYKIEDVEVAPVNADEQPRAAADAALACARPER